MLDLDFCTILEHKIEQAFANSTHGQLKHFSCDGVLRPTFEIEYSKKTVNDNRKIVMTAYIGFTGHDKYVLILKFGKEALSRYARGLDISECIPSPENDNWWDVEIDRRTIRIQLD